MRGAVILYACAVAPLGCARLTGLDDLSRAEPRGTAGSPGDGVPGAVYGSTKFDAGADDAAPGSSTGPSDPGLLTIPNVTVVVVGKLGTGAGIVVSDPPGINCGDVCTARFTPGIRLTVRAYPENGSDSYFVGWSRVDCGSLQYCDGLAAPGLALVEATFATTPHNLAFTTNGGAAPTVGSLEAYDRFCNEQATFAGINNAGADAYVAALSTRNLPLRPRLSAARGWIRPDGSPFADSVEGLFDRGQLFNAPALDEFGLVQIRPEGVNPTLSGTLRDGTTAPDNCDDWTNPAGQMQVGLTAGGPDDWLESELRSCTQLGQLICLGVAKNEPLPVAPSAGAKRIWLSQTTFEPGATRPDALCASALPPGVLEARAFLAYPGRAADAALDAAATYARLDGVVVGTGAEIASGQLRSGIWQRPDGSYSRGVSSPFAWTGQTDGHAPGTPSSTCNDWTTEVGSSPVGRYASIAELFGSAGVQPCNVAGGAHLYCVEP
jgi:hypothetical protein